MSMPMGANQESSTNQKEEAVAHRGKIHEQIKTNKNE